MMKKRSRKGVAEADPIIHHVPWEYLQRQEANQARVIPILLRPVYWTEAPFGHLQILPTDAKPITTWSNRDEAYADVAAGIRRAIQDLALFEASTPRAALPTMWNIPYPRNSFFVGREDILSRLHTQFRAGQDTGLSQPQAISGLGGIGKTQLAVEYAYRFRKEYRAVFWVHAESIEALASSYVSIAALLKLPERDAQEQSIAVQAVKIWLQTHREWLLILDNADELDLLPPFLPPASGGHLFLTTRASAPGHLARLIEVEVFPPSKERCFYCSGRHFWLLMPLLSKHLLETVSWLCRSLWSWGTASSTGSSGSVS